MTNVVTDAVLAPKPRGPSQQVLVSSDEHLITNVDEALQVSKPDLRIKKKGNALPTLSADIKETRMNEFGGEDWVVKLNDDLLNVLVQRQFMRTAYGGGSVQTFPKPTNPKFTHGLKFCYINKEYNSFLPESVGARGLLFTAGGTGELLRSEKWVLHYLFVKQAVNEWVFRGVYEFVPLAPLEAWEWQKQDDSMSPQTQRSYSLTDLLTDPQSLGTQYH
jgi:hypothetical protein